MSSCPESAYADTKPQEGTWIAVAGATGNCGQEILRAAIRAGLRVRALVRDRSRLGDLLEQVDDIVEVDPLDPQSLAGALTGCRCLASALGKTRQKDRVERRRVDVDANSNLFEEARQTPGLERIAFVSVYGADPESPVEMLRMKGDAERALAACGVDHVILRPTGFFSDMTEILEMARKGTIWALGDNSVRMNPISLQDLGPLVVESLLALEGHRAVHEIGGPQCFSWSELAALCGECLDQKVRVRHLPLGLVNALLPLVRPFSRNAWEIAQFMAGSLRLLQQRSPAEMPKPVGNHELGAYYRKLLQA